MQSGLMLIGTEGAAHGGELSHGLLPQILGNHLRRAQVAIFRHFSRTVAAEEDITPGLLGILLLIAANPGLGQTRLAEAMAVDRSATFKVVNQLLRRGLITRKVPPRDRRSYCLYLTEEGERAVRRLETLVLRHEEEFTRVLSADERHILVRLLTRLHQQEDSGTRVAGVTAVDETVALT